MTLIKEIVGNAVISASEGMQKVPQKLPAQLSFYNSEHPDVFYFNQESIFEDPQIPQLKLSGSEYIGRVPDHLLGYQLNFELSLDKEELIINKPKRIPKLHEFGSGRAGTNAFTAFMFGDGCEGPTNGGGRNCGGEPKYTVDVDISGQGEHILVCGEECMVNVINRVQVDLAKLGKYPTARGINGVGRA